MNNNYMENSEYDTTVNKRPQTSIQKNDRFTVEITDQDDLGQGIGKAAGFPLFIKHGVTGDVAEICVTKVKKTYGYGRILKLLSPSSDRVEPACPVYKRCGGCQLQMMSYPAQLSYKQRRVEECLRRIGGCETVSMLPILPSEEPFRYRNKAQLPVGTDADGNPVCGFYAERTHDIISCPDCLLSPEEFGQIAAAVLSWMREEGVPAYEETTGRGLVRHIFLRKAFHTCQIALCLVINGKKLPHPAALQEKLSAFPDIVSLSISVHTKRNNVILGDQVKTLAGTAYIEDAIGDILYRISPQSFFQVNPVQTEKLYRTALSFANLTGKETVLDLYCGIGTISLFLARKAEKVYGIEIVPQAIRDAEQNAKSNGITNAEFHAGKAEEVLPRLYENGLTKADVVVVDPPRKGCDEVTLSTIASLAPDRLVYVSCNPATLARDIRFLRENGFTLEKVQPCDMFPNSVHVECVALLQRTRNTQGKTISLDVEIEDYYRI